ncbi:MAG: NAD(P)/FAD-dependent oxidoreductase [Deltaproteobacteria bacterium]|nr:NAD(P)/FAD-dependent oxidoreductase [Deltaproteobacteria bacterium]
MIWDAVIIGAGAAGLMCAAEAGKRGRRVLVLEHADRVGKKILISGGGRCNFTNLKVGPENFLSANPHFCRSALARYCPEDFLALVQSHGIPYYEKALGQLFCRGSSKEIVAMLLKECEAAKVKIHLKSRIFSIEKKGHFRLDTDQGLLEAGALVVATGGLSYAQLGASPFGYEIARRFGHGLIDCRPALVPLTLPPTLNERWRELSGASAEVRVSCGRASFREALLFTHRGLSGPAILQASSYWEAGEALLIDLLPDLEVRDYLLAKKRAGERSELKNLLSAFLPKRFIERWCELHFPSRPLPQYSDRELAELAALLKKWELMPEGTEGYAKAEVTRGGVDTDGLSSKTMESQKIPGLYFIGEVVDVTGWLGGYNFQWAWASGFAAGQDL